VCEYRTDTEDTVTCLGVTKYDDILVTGSQAGVISVISLTSFDVKVTQCQNGAVTCLVLNSYGTVLVTGTFMLQFYACILKKFNLSTFAL
jgi:hypothetical protein